MFKILFLPFLQIPSGHHHVADCIRVQMEQYVEDFHCEKVDILSYGYGKIENLISSIYLEWIHRLPSLYSGIYRVAAVESKKLNKRFRTYEFLFLKLFKNLLEEKNPDLVICTHALPSYMLARLKKLNIWSGLVINIYTDYFVNNLWGIEKIDYHFVPSMKIKSELLEQGVMPHQIFITGIPIHPLFKIENKTQKKDDLYTGLLSGGNMGAGSISHILNRLTPTGSIRYKVLCGKNDKLLQYVEGLDHPFIQPLSYISSKEEMNRLYDEADVIITKPGGVTISESLAKKLPIFVYDVLPGQEEQNLQYLKKEGLVYHLNQWKIQDNIEEDILNTLQDKKQLYKLNIENYEREIELEDPVLMINNILRDLRKNT